MDMDKMLAYCPHCGSKLLIDVESLNKILIEREKTKVALEKEHTEVEKKRLETEVAIAETHEKEKSERTSFVFALLPIIGCFILYIIMALGVLGDSKKRVPLTNEQACGQTYSSVYNAFYDSSFYYITTIPVESTDKEDLVNSVVINGTSEYSKRKRYPTDTQIVIYYNSRDGLAKIPISGSNVAGMDKNDVLDTLECSGFTNIQTSKVPGTHSLFGYDNRNAIVEMRVNGNSNFSAGDRFETNVEIVIVYYD